MINHPDLLGLDASTDATVFPKGTTAQRPVSPDAGYIRYNTTDDVLETYDGTEWLVLDTLPPAYSVDYLVVAGGGGGGARRGSGGGAGGLRTSYGSTSGGGSSAESSLTLTPSESYTITVGAGGAAASPGSATLGGVGNSSVFASITSIGGGGGASTGTAYPNMLTVDDGGCGAGGAGNNACNPNFNGDTVTKFFGNGTSGQGYNGGLGTKSANGGYGGGGGGGGAASVGQSNTGCTLQSYGGSTMAGGNALSVNINGTANSYSKGGRALNGISTGGLTPGGNNTGNGGDGNAETPGINNGGAAGGSGIVILRMPTANYSGTTTGSPTVTTDGTDTILTYTSSGTYTA